VSVVNDKHLCLKALDMALRRRCPDAGLLHHSDQGSTYASEDYLKLLAAHGITCSMSRRGNCIDNAAMESWFSTLKCELGERFNSYALAKEERFDYMEALKAACSARARRLKAGLRSDWPAACSAPTTQTRSQHRCSPPRWDSTGPESWDDGAPPPRGTVPLRG
jgi:transposase InsO family protein